MADGEENLENRIWYRLIYINKEIGEKQDIIDAIDNNPEKASSNSFSFDLGGIREQAVEAIADLNKEKKSLQLLLDPLKPASPIISTPNLRSPNFSSGRMENMPYGYATRPNMAESEPQGNSQEQVRITPSKIEPTPIPNLRSSAKRDDFNPRPIPTLEYNPSPIFTTEDISELKNHREYLEDKLASLSVDLAHAQKLRGLQASNPLAPNLSSANRNVREIKEKIVAIEKELELTDANLAVLGKQLEVDEAKTQLASKTAATPLTPGSSDYDSANKNLKTARADLKEAEDHLDSFAIGATKDSPDLSNLSDLIPKRNQFIEEIKNSLIETETNRSGTTDNKTVNTDFIKAVKKHEIKPWSASAAGQMNGTALGVLAKEVADNMGITLNSKNYNAFANELSHHDTDAALTAATVYDNDGNVLKEAGEKWSPAKWKSLQVGSQVEFAPELTAKLSTEIQDDRLAQEQQDKKTGQINPMGMK
jgi:hypothetical protein